MHDMNKDEVHSVHALSGVFQPRDIPPHASHRGSPKAEDIGNHHPKRSTPAKSDRTKQILT
jgi:hypothetical protein